MNATVPLGRRDLLAMAAVAAVLMTPVLVPATTDEIFTWWTSRQDWDEMLRIIIGDVHPPLYYWLVHAWQFIAGDSLVMMRAFSGGIAVAGVIGAGLLHKHQSEHNAELDSKTLSHRVVWLLLTLSATTIIHAHCARMYSLMGALGIAGAFAAVQCLRQPSERRWWLVLTSVSVALVLTHHFSAVFAVVLYLWLGVELVTRASKRGEHMKTWAFSGFLCVTLTTPVVLMAIRQATEVKQSYWISDAGASTFAVALLGYFGPFESADIPFAFAVFLTLALAALLLPWRLNELERLFVCQVSAVMVLILTASVIGERPIFVPRYLNTIYPLACLHFISRVRLLTQPLRRCLLLLFAANSVGSIAFVISLAGPHHWVASKKAESGIKDAASGLNQIASTGVPLVFSSPLSYLRHQYHSSHRAQNVYFWNPEAIHQAKTEHRVFLSAVPISSRLSEKGLRQLGANTLVFVDGGSDLPPAWAPQNPSWLLPRGTLFHRKPRL